MSRTRRVYWEVLPIRGFAGWQVTRNGHQADKFVFKFLAVMFAVRSCNLEWSKYSYRSELIIKGRDGKIKDKRTYGVDPRESKG